MHQKPFCASTHGAQTLVGFCIHIWFNKNIVVECPQGKSTWQWWHVKLCWHVGIFFVRVYFDMSWNLSKEYSIWHGTNISKIFLPTPIHRLMFLFTRSQNNNPHELFVLIINKIDYVVCDCGVCYFECAKGSTFWSVVVGRLRWSYMEGQCV
jgi:hypothetical protein